GVETQLQFKALETKLFKFFIPKSTSKDEDYKVNSVVIGVAPLLPNTEDIILAASTKQDVAPSSASRKGVPGWRKGKTLRLSEYYKEDWCTDCWVTILVDVTEAGTYQILAKTNVGVMQIR